MPEADVERAFFQAKGVLPTPKYLDADGTLKDVPAADPVFVTDVVRAVCHKYEMAAAEVWGHTVTDLFVMLRPPEDTTVTADDRGSQITALLLIEDRRKRLAALGVAERIELEQWKAELT